MDTAPLPLFERTDQDDYSGAPAVSPRGLALFESKPRTWDRAIELEKPVDTAGSTEDSLEREKFPLRKGLINDQIPTKTR